MFAIIALLSVGVGLVAGGVAYTSVMGYNALVPQLWIQGFSLMGSSPSTIISEAINGTTAELFQGIIMVSLGVVLVITSGLVLILKPLVKDVFTARRSKDSTPKVNRTSFLKRSKKQPTLAKGAQRLDDTEFGDSAPTKAPQEKGPSTLEKIQERLKAASRKDEFSAKITDEEEGEGVPKKSWSSRLRDSMPKPKERTPSARDEEVQSTTADTHPWGDVPDSEQAAMRDTIAKSSLVATHQKSRGKGTAKIKMRDKNAVGIGAAIQASLDKAWDAGVGRLAAKFTGGRVKKAPEIFVSEEEHSVKKNALDDAKVMQWYADVQSGARPVRELIAEAVEIRAEMSGESKEAFVERNSMDGSFILRLAESWATRTDAETVVEDSGERAAMREAVRAVYRERAGQIRKDETSVPEEFRKSVDEDSDEDEGMSAEDSWEQEYAESQRTEPVPVLVEQDEEANAPVDATARLLEKLAKVAFHMREYTVLLQSVRNGEDEWPEELAEEDYRMDAVKEIGDEYSSVSFMLSDEEILEHAQDSEDQGLAWLSENSSIITIGFAEFIRGIEMGGFGDDDDGDDLQPAGDDEAFDGGEDGRDPSDVEPESSAPQEDESVPVLIQDSTDQEEESPAPYDDEPQAPSVEVGPQEDADKADDQQPDGDESESMVDPSVQDVPAGAPHEEEVQSPDIGEEDKPRLGSGPEEEPSATHANDTAVQEEESGEGDEPDAAEDTPGQDTVEADLVIAKPASMPRNIGGQDLEEMEKASPFVQEWAVSSKEAGAANGALMRYLSDRSSGALKPVGFVHLVMLWKERGPTGRGNVLFRFLEDGVWGVDPATPGRFVRDNGDWVEMQPHLLQHDEMKAGMNIVQIHGPGATDALVEAAKVWGSLWVVNTTPSSADLIARLDAQT